ncbi:hypothetical protein V5799_004774 [Amblyomma americanum]|uniref:Uncharacterized protein n=1 Tax=Amblyomma americanum TaxID=6943 RepID=A0AAQ4D553_AMBAM
MPRGKLSLCRQPGQAGMCEDAPREQASPTTCMEWSHSSDDGGGGSSRSADLVASALMDFFVDGFCRVPRLMPGPQSCQRDTKCTWLGAKMRTTAHSLT